jgi:cytochrome d ubiquinol oxidase subunit II
VAFGNLAHGVPIDAEMNYAGNFFTLLNPYALVAGVAAVTLFSLHGAVFLSLKTTGELQEKAHAAARRLWPATVVVLLILLVTTYLATDIYDHLGLIPGVIPLTGMAAVMLVGYFLAKKLNGWAFVMTALTIATSLITAFLIMFPRVMISTLNPEWSLTIYNASSSPYTLKVMTIVALIFVPIVLLYQGWSYWVFRKRIIADPETLTY